MLPDASPGATGRLPSFATAPALEARCGNRHFSAPAKIAELDHVAVGMNVLLLMRHFFLEGQPLHRSYFGIASGLDPRSLAGRREFDAIGSAVAHVSLGKMNDMIHPATYHFASSLCVVQACPHTFQGSIEHALQESRVESTLCLGLISICLRAWLRVRPFASGIRRGDRGGAAIQRLPASREQVVDVVEPPRV